MRYLLLSHGLARSHITDRGDGLQTRRVAGNILNKRSRTADKGFTFQLGGCETGKLLAVKAQRVTKWKREAFGRRNEQRKTETGFGTWNVRDLCRSGSLESKTVARRLARGRLDLLGVQEIRSNKRDTERAEDLTFFCAKGNENHQLGTEFFLYIRG